jgi:hypothetical protein
MAVSCFYGFLRFSEKNFFVRFFVFLVKFCSFITGVEMKELWVGKRLEDFSNSVGVVKELLKALFYR